MGKIFTKIITIFICILTLSTSIDSLVTPQFYRFWNDKDVVEEYIYNLYGHTDFTKFILYTIDRESSYNHLVKNKSSSAIGLMQVTKSCAYEEGYDYWLVSFDPQLNIKCGTGYLKKCYNKAKGNWSAAREYYKNGLNYKI
jgi:hypothetical protein